MSLADLRREVAGLEARRDELAARLAVLGEVERRSPEPAPEPEEGHWRFRPTNPGSLVLVLIAAVCLLLFDHILVRLFFGGIGLFLVSHMIWPPWITMDEEGLRFRFYVTAYDFPWSEVRDFRLSTKSHKVEVQTKDGWQTFTFGTSSEEVRLAVDAHARAWIDATRTRRRRRKKKRKGKRSRRRRRS